MSVDTNTLAENTQYVTGGLYAEFASVDKQYLLIAARDHFNFPDAPTTLEDEIGAAETWLGGDADAEELPLIVRISENKALWLGHVVRADIENCAGEECPDPQMYAAKVLACATFQTPSFEDAITSLAGHNLLEAIREGVEAKKKTAENESNCPSGSLLPADTSMLYLV